MGFRKTTQLSSETTEIERIEQRGWYAHEYRPQLGWECCPLFALMFWTGRLRLGPTRTGRWSRAHQFHIPIPMLPACLPAAAKTSILDTMLRGHAVNLHPVSEFAGMTSAKVCTWSIFMNAESRISLMISMPGQSSFPHLDD